MARSRLALVMVSCLLPMTLAACGGSVADQRPELIDSVMTQMSDMGLSDTQKACVKGVLEGFSDDELNALGEEPIPADLDKKFTDQLTECIAAG